MKYKDVVDETLMHNRFAEAGLLAISLLAMFELLSVDNRSFLQWLALLCLTVAVPLLGCRLWILSLIEQYRYVFDVWYEEAAATGGSIAALLGLTLFVFSESWFLGITFAAAGIFAANTWYLYLRACRAKRARDDKE